MVGSAVGRFFGGEVMDRWLNKILLGNAPDVLMELPDKSINCCVTSPPYWGLRDYGVEGQLGLERTPGEYVERMVTVFREVRRVLKNDGTLWLNLGDSYAGSGKGPSNSLNKEYHHLEDKMGFIVPDGLKPKDLVGIPWRVAFALQADGWYLRSDIIWHKPNPMPESVTDRPTKSHEYIFLMSKNAKYYYDAEAVKENATCAGQDRGKSRNISPERTTIMDNKQYDTRNKRSVWTVATQPFSEAHFATFPPDLINPCILAGCPEGGIVLDPFMGAGTTAVVCANLGRNYIGIELNPEYVHIANERIKHATRQERLFL